MTALLLVLATLAQCSSGSCSNGGFSARAYRQAARQSSWQEVPSQSSGWYEVPSQGYTTREWVVPGSERVISSTVVSSTATTSDTSKRLDKLEQEVADTKKSVNAMQTSFDRMIAISEKQTELMNQQLVALTAIQATTAAQFDLLGEANDQQAAAAPQTMKKPVKLLDLLPPPGGG